VDAVQVSGGRRLEVDQEKVEAPRQGIGRLLDEGFQGVPTPLVARRKDLDQSDDPVAAAVADDQPSLRRGVGVRLQGRCEADARRRHGDGRRPLSDFSRADAMRTDGF